MFQLFLLKFLFAVVLVFYALVIPVTKLGHAYKARINSTQHSLIHSLAHSLTRSLAHSPLTHSLTHPFIHSFIHSFIRLFVHLVFFVSCKNKNTPFSQENANECSSIYVTCSQACQFIFGAFIFQNYSGDSLRILARGLLDCMT